MILNKKINKVFATGGIGTGVVFKLHEDKAMARAENRTGLLMDYKNYGKAHIILHYNAALTKGMDMKVYAVGMVGADDAGKLLKRELNDGGIDTQFVKSTEAARTMFSVRWQYPDGSMGSITDSESACDKFTSFHRNVTANIREP
jgi:hypothetical protein